MPRPGGGATVRHRYHDGIPNNRNFLSELLHETNPHRDSGGAGLVGQNLVARLKAQGTTTSSCSTSSVRISTSCARRIPTSTAIYADLAEPGDWAQHFEGADVVVMLQAQIGAHHHRAVHAQQHRRPHATCSRPSSSTTVPYTRAHQFLGGELGRRRLLHQHQEASRKQLVVDSGIALRRLRPTLMFGWFDRKHLGWLSRFMQRDRRCSRSRATAATCASRCTSGDFCRDHQLHRHRASTASVYDICGARTHRLHRHHPHDQARQARAHARSCTFPTGCFTCC